MPQILTRGRLVEPSLAISLLRERDFQNSPCLFGLALLKAFTRWGVNDGFLATFSPTRIPSKPRFLAKVASSRVLIPDSKTALQGRRFRRAAGINGSMEKKY